MNLGVKHNSIHTLGMHSWEPDDCLARGPNEDCGDGYATFR